MNNQEAEETNKKPWKSPSRAFLLVRQLASTLDSLHLPTSYSRDPGQPVFDCCEINLSVADKHRFANKVDANCQRRSGMPVWFGTNDLNTNLVVGRDFRRPAQGQACSPSLHDLTGQN